jgi:hypothetical protein
MCAEICTANIYLFLKITFSYPVLVGFWPKKSYKKAVSGLHLHGEQISDWFSAGFWNHFLPLVPQ